LGFILVFFLSYVPFFSAALYRLPIIPLMLLFGAYGICSVAHAIRARERRVLAWLGAGIGMYMLTSHPLVPYESPGPAAWRILRSKACTETGDLNRAVEELRAALRVSPDDREAHGLLARLLDQQGHGEQAAIHRAKFGQLRREEAERYFRLATALKSKGDAARATVLFGEAVRTDPKHTRARYEFASMLASQGRNREARHHARVAVTLDPNDPAMRCLLGDTLLRQGKIQAALRRYREALLLDPNHREARESLEAALRMKHRRNND
jgi:tetratricopeptide (TPR) repeat protein